MIAGERSMFSVRSFIVTVASFMFSVRRSMVKGRRFIVEVDSFRFSGRRSIVAVGNSIIEVGITILSARRLFNDSERNAFDLVVLSTRASKNRFNVHFDISCDRN